ncbi:MAG: hypothetical protein KC431_26785 [Myxococcales bacterium]|nr:hypothetical protein [Myxococcales bacterium]
MKLSRTQEQRFIPWVHEDHGLELRIIGGVVDNRPLEGDLRGHVLDLSASWCRARLEFMVQVPTRVVRRVVAEHERDDPPLAVVVALRCDQTHLRQRVCLRDWQAHDPEPIVLELVRADLAGQVELSAFLIRTRPLEDAGAGVAAAVGVRLASARPYYLQIDEPAVHQGNYLDVQYRSFAVDPTLAAEQRSALYRLDLEREDPVLYLNTDYEPVRIILDGKGTHGARARTRDLLFERIEAGIWTQLLLQVSARLVEDGDLAYPWEQGLLEQWLPRLYPEAVDDDARKAQLELEYRRLPSLLARLDLAMQVFGGLGERAGKLAGDL